MEFLKESVTSKSFSVCRYSSISSYWSWNAWKNREGAHVFFTQFFTQTFFAHLVLGAYSSLAKKIVLKFNPTIRSRFSTDIASVSPYITRSVLPVLMPMRSIFTSLINAR